jgi:hypothetical protein
MKSQMASVKSYYVETNFRQKEPSGIKQRLERLLFSQGSLNYVGTSFVALALSTEASTNRRVYTITCLTGLPDGLFSNRKSQFG